MIAERNMKAEAVGGTGMVTFGADLTRGITTSVRYHRGQRTFSELSPGVFRNHCYATLRGDTMRQPRHEMFATFLVTPLSRFLSR